MAGVHNMWTGFGASVNTFFVPLEEHVGAANVVDAAKRMGIKFRVAQENNWANDKVAANQWGAFTLGVSATTPLELANAYATLAADGKYCEPNPVQEIRDQDGNKLDVANPRCRAAVRPEVARAAVDAARCPVGDNSSTSRCAGRTARQRPWRASGKPVAGKSGTTDEREDRRAGRDDQAARGRGHPRRPGLGRDDVQHGARHRSTRRSTRR